MSDPRTVLAGLRGDPRRRYATMALGGVAGLLLALFHWTGFVVGGALVGLAATDFKRALGAGALYGAVGGVAFAGWLAVGTALGDALATGQVVVLSVAIPVVAATFGSLARGLA